MPRADARRSIFPWLAFALSLVAPAIAFVILFAHDATDDYAGWTLALAALGAPASLVILRDRDPIPTIGVVALALPAALAAGSVSAAVAFVAPIPEIAQAAILLGVAPIVTIAAGVVLTLTLRGQPTRDAARRVFAAVALPAIVAVLMTARSWSGLASSDALEASVQIAGLLLGLLPLLWILGPGVVWAACALTRPRPRR